MSFLKDYAIDFDADVRKRGEAYQKASAVTIIDQGPGFVEAEVEGSQLYRSTIDRKPGLRPVYECNCVYFADHGPCKHCWATILEASEAGVLPGPEASTVSSQTIDPDDADEPAIEEGDDIDANEEDEDSDSRRSEPMAFAPGSPAGRTIEELKRMSTNDLLGALRFRGPQDFAPGRQNDPRLSKPAMGDDERWKSQLSRLSEAMRGRPTVAPRPLVWPTGRRLLFVVDVAESRQRGLTLSLMQETPKSAGAYEKPKHLRITQSQVSQLPDADDRRIVQLLTGTGRSGYGYYYDNQLAETFDIDETAAEDVLKTITTTGRARLHTSGGTFLHLNFDDGPAWEFCLQIKPSPGGRYLLLDGLLRRPLPEPALHSHPMITDLAGTDGLEGDGLDEEGVLPGDESTAEGSTPGTLSPDGAIDTDVAKLSADLPDAPTKIDTSKTSAEAPFEEVPLAEPHLLLHGLGDGFVFIGTKVARLRHFDAFPLITALRAGEKISIPVDKQTELLKMLLKFPRLPRLQLPSELEIVEVAPAPKPRLKLTPPGKSQVGGKDSLVAQVTFEYDGQIFTRGDKKAAIVTDDGHKLIRRDAVKEASYLGELTSLGFREDSNYFNNTRDIRLPLAKMPKAVGELTRRGWTVEADGKLYRSAGQVNVSVSSGIDWFELHGEVSFDGGLRATLPQLLSALRKGESVVRLDDGTLGLLPEEWLKKYAGLASLGETEGDAIKFSTRQIGFLDALLTSMPEARFDETFSKARNELMRFSGIEAIEPPDTFQGQLRQYQSEGLGWMAFLRKFGFGGVLADDMGLGKTVQVLALLEARRRERVAALAAADKARIAQASEQSKTIVSDNGSATAPAEATGGTSTIAENQGTSTIASGDASTTPSLPEGAGSTYSLVLDRHSNQHGPSLVVAPRSLVFNWRAEAEKFSPGLRVLDHTAVDRVRSADHFRDYDLILTTYGTLRRDMSYFRDIRFDYAILDEAQAIKNGSSESAKAARLINADHRLALSGTPVQNHLGELWSLFDYLNPGMMGSVGVFRDLSADAANKDSSARELLARSLRPFILRRTKEQVARDLPEKLEQTLYCELEKDQRKLYDELRDHYRTALLERVAREGMNKAKIMVLEALLRLRQAACHPGLIDKGRTGEPSAKLDTLMDHLAELVDEGHKVLVFSQFTSMLAIVRERLDKQEVIYEYLDGRTKDRQARVDRFQTDEACKLFLISLKAGGVGLNLTAAEYVFLLDPWWNPAVEAQAIDRAHRIGQTRQVFAYRLIAKDTVEEKVLQLQQSKKDLADAIINADNSLIRGLSRDDLEMLLS